VRPVYECSPTATKPIELQLFTYAFAYVVGNFHRYR